MGNQVYVYFEPFYIVNRLPTSSISRVLELLDKKYLSSKKLDSHSPNYVRSKANRQFRLPIIILSANI